MGTRYKHAPLTLEEQWYGQPADARSSPPNQHDAILQMQETAGNAAVTAVLGRDVQRQPEGAEPVPADAKGDTKDKKPAATITIEGLADHHPLESVQIDPSQ